MSAERIPEVSVVMPLYNAEAYVEQTVLSVIGQTFSDWELIIVDDHSPDGSLAIVEEICKTDDRIRILRNEKNLGVSETRNRGINESRGKYIALLDSDDLWYPEKLEKQVALATETGADIIYCSYAMLRGDEATDFIVPPETDFEKSLVRSVISCSTALLSKEGLGERRFSKEFVHEDLVLWLELLKDGKRARGCTEVLAAYRLIEGSRSFNKLKAAKNRWKVYRACLKLPFFKSVRYFFVYAVAALKKYK